MRPIDADALMETFETRCVLAWVKNIVNNAPTIDATPTVHGVWSQKKIIELIEHSEITPQQEYFINEKADNILAGKQNTTTQHIKELLKAEQEGRLLISPIVPAEKQYTSPCKDCSNNPVNGGSGICNCTLGTIGTMSITY